MDRIIKFRIWDLHDKKMLYVDGIFNEHPGHSNSIMPQYDLCWKDHEIQIMQYTGIKDKNGIEIYEDDIFIDENTINGAELVIWNFFIYDIIELGYTENQLKIIGNVYENPELLKEEVINE